jgi:hypothetical protein
MSDADTMWSEYSHTNFTGCAYPIVPSVVVDPIMSALTAASWADSGKITRDTLDTCVVEVQDNGITRIFSIDMLRGVVIGFMIYGGTESAQHQYFWGYDKEIYYLQKVTFSAFDTTITNGGYEFYNIRVNGETVTPVIIPAKRKRERFSIQWVDRRQGTISLTGITGPSRIALFDIQGRRISSGEYGINGPFAITRLCPGRGCPSGPLLVRIENGVFSRVFSVISIR